MIRRFGAGVDFYSSRQMWDSFQSSEVARRCLTANAWLLPPHKALQGNSFFLRRGPKPASCVTHLRLFLCAVFRLGIETSDALQYTLRISLPILHDQDPVRAGAEGRVDGTLEDAEEGFGEDWGRTLKE